jgi:hypothetical protein
MKNCSSSCKLHMLAPSHSSSANLSRYLQVDLTSPFFCNNARSHCEFSVSYGFMFISVFAIDFILLAFHITRPFYFPVPALHSLFVSVTALSHAHVLLAFSALSPRYPSSTWSRYPRTLYTLTVFNITCIPISCASCLFAFYTFVCNIEALCVHSCSLKGPIDGRL